MGLSEAKVEIQQSTPKKSKRGVENPREQAETQDIKKEKHKQKDTKNSTQKCNRQSTRDLW
jgi:hypothetical protein